MDISLPDPVTSGDQTGLQEPMWQLGLGSGSETLPQRQDEADCIYYLRTGFCGYGSRCRFNHPPDRASVVGAMRSGAGDYPERIGEAACQFYMRTGMCKFGASCKYHHPRHGVGSSSTVPLNMSGYPLRPGEKECSYYVKTGQCKFGVTCKFHHPQPAIIPPPPPPQAPPLPPEYGVGSSQQYGVFARPSLLPGPYFPGPYSPLLVSPTMVPFPGWNPYQAPASPAASPNTVGTGPFYAIAPRMSSVPSYTGSYLSGPSSSGKKEHSLPERPGEPVCQYYLQTGDCKYGSSCRYHHPLEWTAPNSNVVLGPMGLPLRPGASVCTHYSQKGVCKFGPSCKFDHPMGMLSYSSSASSLAETPVAPYPVGVSIATLTPSSSSSNLRPDQLSAANKDGLSTSTPSGSGRSAGSNLSKNTPVSDSTGGTSTTHGHST